MTAFSSSEMSDMLLMYGRARRLPDHRTFSTNIQRLQWNGEFRPRTTDRGRDRTQAVLHVEPDILDLVDGNPAISVRRLAYHVGVSLFVVL